MKRPFIIFIAIVTFLTSHSQSVPDFGKFPVLQNDTTPLLTTNLLDGINWQAIKSFCSTAKGHYAYENKDSLLTSYRYIKQGNEASFEIISYNGMVMEYHTDAGSTKPQSSASYFNKRYGSTMLMKCCLLFQTNLSWHKTSLTTF